MKFETNLLLEEYSFRMVNLDNISKLVKMFMLTFTHFCCKTIESLTVQNIGTAQLFLDYEHTSFQIWKGRADKGRATLKVAQ